MLETLSEWRAPYEDVDIEVNSKGEIRKRSDKTTRFTQINNSGYAYTYIMTNGIRKTYFIHRLVAKAFLPDFSEDKVVDHINGIRTDNDIKNLRCVSAKDNTVFGHNNRKNLYLKINQIIVLYGYEETEKLLDKILQNRNFMI